MIKLVASDLDGTLLLNGAQQLPEEIFPLIRELKKLGILFVAASGRQYPNMRRLFDPVADEMAFICENGALAVRNEKVFYQDNFEPEAGERNSGSNRRKGRRRVFLRNQRLLLYTSENTALSGSDDKGGKNNK